MQPRPIHLPSSMMDLLRGLVETLLVFYAFGLATALGSPGVGPQLQDKFCVGNLPNVTWTIGRQYAGNLPVQRGTNISLFFWAVESQQGSLTAPAGENNAPWNIWLQGCVACFALTGSTSTCSLSKLTCFSFPADPGRRAWPAFCSRCVPPNLDSLLRHLFNLSSPERSDSAERGLLCEREPVQLG